MADSVNRLPVEVWLNIFDQIQDKPQLVQCKLVCKRWAPLVEMAILKSVVLTQTNIPKLYQHLLKNPRSSRYIQVIDIAKYRAEDLPNIHNILTVAMTPSLKKLHGSVWTYDFLDIIVNIALQKFANDKLKLEDVPGTALNNYGYVTLVHLMKKTLRHLHVGLVQDTTQDFINLICDKLDEFESLTDLHLFDLQGYIDTLPKLDNMLRNCPRLQSLLLLVDQSPARTAIDDNLDRWLSQNVQKVNSLKSIKFRNSPRDYREVPSGGFNADVLRYLSFKYPKVQHVEMKYYLQRNQPILRSIFENAETVKLLDWYIDTMDHVEEIMDVWKSQNNSIAIKYEYSSNRDFSCSMDIDKVKETGHTQFVLTNILLQVPLERIQQIISRLGNTLTKKLEIDIVEYQNVNGGANSLSTILQSTPFIEHLTINSDNLVQELPLAPLTRLHTLELESMRLTDKEMINVASWAPHLEHLMLRSCRVSASEYDVCGTMYQSIVLPELALSSLSLEGRWPGGTLSIELDTARSQQRLFFNLGPTEPIVQTTWEECKMNDQGNTVNLIIKCKSLKHLSVKLGNVVAEMEFDQEGNVIESSPAIINSKMMQLQQENQLLHTKNASLEAENQALAAKYEQAKGHLTQDQIQAIEEQDM